MKIQIPAGEGVGVKWVLIGKELDSVTWDGGVWEDPIEAENFERSDSQWFIPPEEVVSLPSIDHKLTPHPLKCCSFHL